MQRDASEVRARFSNTPRRATVARKRSKVAGTRALRRFALSACCTLAVTPALGGCGGGSPSAQTLLEQTFRSSRAIESASIDLSVSLSPGSRARGAAVSLRLTGAFQSVGVHRLPRFTLQLDLRLQRGAVRLGAIDTAGRLFVLVGGTAFRAPVAAEQALKQGYAEVQRPGPPSAGGHGLPALGLDPASWLEHPSVLGGATVGGQSTVHVAAGIAVQRFLADAQRLVRAASALPLGEPAPLAASLSALGGPAGSARADLYTGTGDHLVRRLRIELVSGAVASGSAPAGSPARLTLELTLGAINASQTIRSPANPQPSGGLARALARGTSQAGGAAGG